MSYREPHSQVYTRLDEDTIARFRHLRQDTGISVNHILQTGIELWLDDSRWQAWALEQIQERRIMLAMEDVLLSQVHTTRLAGMIPDPLHEQFFKSLADTNMSMQDVLALIVEEFCSNESFRSYFVGAVSLTEILASLGVG
jgi:hypothetical protein